MTDSTPTAHERRGILAWIVLHPKSFLVIIIALLLVVFVLLSHHAAESRLQRRIDAIRARGEPVTIEDINATIPTLAPEENKALVMLEYVRRMARDSAIPEEKQLQLPLLGRAPSYPTGTAIPAEQLEAIHWYLSQYPDELAGIHEALAMSHGTFNVHFSSPAFQVTAVEWSEYRAIGKVLAIQAMLHANEGNREAAAEGLLAQLQLGRVLDSDYPVLMSLFVQLSLDMLAFDGIERTINHCGLQADVLHQLQGAIAAVEETARIREGFMVERVAYIDTLNWTLAGNPLTPGTFAPAGATGVWPYLPGFKRFEGATNLQMHTSLIDAIGEPDPQTLDRCRQVEQHYVNMPEYYPYAKLAIRSFVNTVGMWLNHVGRNRALQAAVASERYRLERGSWPESLANLVPDYLSAVPIDPFDDREIRYAVIPEGIKVWSIGKDQTDHGGNVMRLEAFGKRTKSTDFGWVILNPDLRGRPAEETESVSNEQTPTTILE